MISRKNSLFEQGAYCITLLAVGVSNAPFIPRNLQRRLFPFILLALVLNLIVSLCYQSRRSKKEIKREQKDERNQMILEKSVWYCRQAEDWILLGLFTVFAMGLHMYEIAYTLYWVMIGRSILSFGIRWWLNRKY